MPTYDRETAFACLIVLLMVSTVIIYFQYASKTSTPLRLPTTLIYSGIKENSFNPCKVTLVFTKHPLQTSTLSIIDNNTTAVAVSELSQMSLIKVMLSDGFHRLDIIFYDSIRNVELYESIDIVSGSQTLQICILDQRKKPVKNVLVHLELTGYPHIASEHYTNHLGKVNFHNLPKNTSIYIEAICKTSMRYAFLEIQNLVDRLVYMTLNEIRSSYDDEYDPSDRGYYAV